MSADAARGAGAAAVVADGADGAASAAGSSSSSSRIALVGSGNSTGVPWLHCVLHAASRCAVCADCLARPTSRNVRNNVSALVSIAPAGGGRPRHILIDCGKTFRTSALSTLPALGVTALDAVLLTHAHADAMQGLDDLRDISPSARLPVYASEPTFRRVAACFDYLVREGAPVRPPAGRSAGEPAPAGADADAPPATFIAQLDWRIIRPFEPFEVAGLIVTPLPLEHGEPGPMLGFEFHHTAAAAEGIIEPAAESGAAAAVAPPGARVVYLSDIAALPLDTRAYLRRGAPIDLLFVDALGFKPYPTHFSVGQAVACALDLRAQRAVLVGMGHHIDYYAEQPRLAAYAAARGADMEFGYDGWAQALRLHAPTPRIAVAAALRAANVAAQDDWRAGPQTPPPPPLPAVAAASDASSAEPESPVPAGGKRVLPQPTADAPPCRPSPLDAEFDAAARRAGDDFAGWVPPAQLPTFAHVAARRGALPLPPAPPVPPPAVPAWPLSRHGRPPAVNYGDAARDHVGLEPAPQ